MPDRTRTAAWGAATLMIAATTVACSGDAEDIPLAAVADSDGVRIVTYDLTDTTVPTYRVVADYDLQVGVQDGAPEYTFSSITDLAIAPDGSVVVSDRLARELRVYDANGSFLRAIGQSGEGPGEFANAPIIVGFAVDTVFAFDRRSSRLTSFTMGGNLVATTTLRSPTSGRPVFMIRQEDGTYLSQSPWVNPEPDLTLHDFRLELDSMVIERLDADGALIDTVLVMADRTRARLSQDVGGGMFRTMEAPPPFHARSFLRSDGVRPIVGRNDSFELHLFGPAGEPQTVLRVLGVQNLMTGDELRERQEAALRESQGEDINPMVWQLNVEFIPDRLQAFQTIVVSEDGDIWVALTEYDGSRGYNWLVFDPSGELRGSVFTPPDMTLFEVRGDFIVGVYQDDLDVSYFRRYPLAPGGA